MSESVQSSGLNCSSYTGHCWHRDNIQRGQTESFVCCYCRMAGWQTHGPYAPQPVVASMPPPTPANWQP